MRSRLKKLTDYFLSRFENLMQSCP